MKPILLSILRDRLTPTAQFRGAANELFALMAVEESLQINDHDLIVIVAILRSGAAPLPFFLHTFANAPVGFYGIKRDENTAMPQKYYENIPLLSPENHLLLLDPMIATGGSAHLAISDLISKGANASRITIISAIAALPGIDRIHKQFPLVKIKAAATDKQLDAKKFIVPGLGDFGDRYFGT